VSRWEIQLIYLSMVIPSLPKLDSAKLQSHATFILATSMILAGFLWGAERLSRRNPGPNHRDQCAYLYATQAASQQGFFYEGARGPLYVQVLRAAYRPGESLQSQFERSKQLNIALSVLVVIGLLLVFRAYLPAVSAIALGATCAFAYLIYYAPYVKSEEIYFLFGLLSFLTLTTAAAHRRLRDGAVAGMLTGVAYMFKATALAGLAIFLVTMATAGLVTLIRGRLAIEARRAAVRIWLVATVVAIAFCVAAAPQLLYSHRKFGRPFYNVNTTFYFWYDSWAEAKAGTRAHGDRIGPPNMPADQLPSASRYVRTHTVEQIVDRLVNGGISVRNISIRRYGYGHYVVLYVLALGLLVILNWRLAWMRVRVHMIPVTFVLAYFAVHLPIIFWYMAISPSPRFIVVIVAPLLFTCAYAIHKVGADARTVIIGGRRLDSGDLLTAATLACLVFDIPKTLLYDLTVQSGGG
jgi:hypothetical protein